MPETSLIEEGASRVATETHIYDLILGSGPVVKFVLLILVVMSIVTWGIAYTKWGRIRKAKRQSEAFSDVFWSSRNLSEIEQTAKDLKDSPIASVFDAGYRELMSLTRSETSDAEDDFGDIQNLDRALKKAKAEELTRLEVGTTFLATTASAAPFIGLFGTVWGIMNAFIGLSHVKSSSIQAVAPGISEALIATAIGLAAAIPAAISYNYFMQQIRIMARKMDTFSAEFLNIARNNFLR